MADDYLVPCTAFEFDLQHAGLRGRPGYEFVVKVGRRCKGWLDGRLVLLMVRRRGVYAAAHYRLPLPATPVEPRAVPEGFNYK